MCGGPGAADSPTLVDCLISKERFRADKVFRPEVGAKLDIARADKGQAGSGA